MATEHKKDPKVEVEAGPQVRAIHGPMVDMSTGNAYDVQPVEFTEMTPWMQMQIDAGKMEVC